MKRYLTRLLIALTTLLLCSGFVTAAPLLNLDLSLDRDVLPAGQRETAVIKVALNVPEIPREVERPPVNLTLVLDRSGSMAGDKITKARDAAITALRLLGPQDLFSLVVYDHNVQTLIPPQSAANSEWLETRIRQIAVGGNTALFGAVSQGAAEVRKNLERNFVHRVVLLSDGLANVGPSSPADLARLGAALLKEGISVTTIGIGNGFNEDLMSQLADRSDGNHYFVESSIDLPRIFAAELGDVLSVAARRISLELETPQGVQPVRIIGREGRIVGNRVELHLNQLYGGQEKYALIEVQVEPGKPEQQLDIANARCYYENALTNHQENTIALAQVRFSPNQQDVLRSANKPVIKAIVENEIATSQERALDLYNAGRKDEAVAEIRAKSAQLRSQSDSLGFSDLSQEAQVFEEAAETFAAPALPSAVKKEIRSESYKVRKQQKDY
ncbi:Ca-activated chloride channel family protein [Malonomonas rubra DSM 5091]|uniref:Ca-activated chloride channel family protein n=1 Tax=Malonomonas rubra DSM 5091 TaxID=1122189 RepID=A0A1M6EWY9_MALRU|nr:VWA domain-containing protein [Malonomonas rubra]SHI89955.1 Ca-activated chloride channel family protein [Malonomonas rubra DSM 5091]